MDSDYLRALLALLVAGIAWWQASQSRGQPLRQRALQLAALSFVLAAGVNILVGAGMGWLGVPLALGVAAAAALLAALVVMMWSLRRGETRVGAGVARANAERDEREEHREY